MMTGHRDSLRSYLQDTPAASAAAETRVATAVSKLLTVLAGERRSDLVEEARSDVYLDVLDDVPCWAVESAVRAWFKHDCGTDERGKAARLQMGAGSRARCARSRCARSMRSARASAPSSACWTPGRMSIAPGSLRPGTAALAGLNKVLKSGDLDGARSLTFEQAIARAGEPDQPAAPLDQPQEAAE
jgi:hypothetical protein